MHTVVEACERIGGSCSDPQSRSQNLQRTLKLAEMLAERGASVRDRAVAMTGNTARLKHAGIGLERMLAEGFPFNALEACRYRRAGRRWMCWAIRRPSGAAPASGSRPSGAPGRVAGHGDAPAAAPAAPSELGAGHLQHPVADAAAIIPGNPGRAPCPPDPDCPEGALPDAADDGCPILCTEGPWEAPEAGHLCLERGAWMAGSCAGAPVA
uniref:Uncharacterized protein n=1 Tax=Tetraselmis sp. GSL018 TaxID=582737 RepID=A0A061QP94_9CHLO